MFETINLKKNIILISRVTFTRKRTNFFSAGLILNVIKRDISIVRELVLIARRVRSSDYLLS